jgi:hypothetical protein
LTCSIIGGAVTPRSATIPQPSSRRGWLWLNQVSTEWGEGQSHACHTLTVQGGYNKSGQTRIVPFNSAVSTSLTRLKVQAMSEFVFTTLTGKPYDSGLGLSRLAPAPVWKASPRTQRDIYSRRDLSATKLICEPCKSWADGRAYDC